MAVIDRVKWDGLPDTFAYRFPSENLSTWTQLIVNESQEAYLVKEGVYQGPFNAGRHTLSTENIPLIRGLINAPFGGRTPFTAEVWFVNRATNLDIRWGTPDPIQLQDPKFGIAIPVRAFGQYGVRIIDSKKFLLKLVGTLRAFDSETVVNYFRGVFTTRIKTSIAKMIVKHGTSVLEIATELDDLSSRLKDSLAPEMAEYGLGLVQFNIHSINVPDDDPAVESLRATLAKRTEMQLLGYTYQQERSFDVLETAAGNEGSAGSVMGAGLGMGMGIGIGAPLGQAAAQMVPQIQTASAPASPAVRDNAGAMNCDKCGVKIPRNSKFCPNCADPVNACPSCGEDNPSDASACRRCGQQFPGRCRKCSAAQPMGATFCPECGERQKQVCVKCNAEISAGARFCAECGEKQT